MPSSLTISLPWSRISLLGWLVASTTRRMLRCSPCWLLLICCGCPVLLLFPLLLWVLVGVGCGLLLVTLVLMPSLMPLGRGVGSSGFLCCLGGGSCWSRSRCRCWFGTRSTRLITLLTSLLTPRVCVLRRLSRVRSRGRF